MMCPGAREYQSSEIVAYSNGTCNNPKKTKKAKKAHDTFTEESFFLRKHFKRIRNEFDPSALQAC